MQKKEMKTGSVIYHKKYGKCIVTEITGEIITVRVSETNDEKSFLNNDSFWYYFSENAQPGVSPRSLPARSQKANGSVPPEGNGYSPNSRTPAPAVLPAKREAPVSIPKKAETGKTRLAGIIVGTLLLLLIIFFLSNVSCSNNRVPNARPVATQYVKPTPTATPRPTSTPEPVLYGPYKVTKIVDGDTIDVSINKRTVRVRLIGVDTPESVHPDKSMNTPEGKEASKYTKSLLKGKKVYLEYDVTNEDTYGRTLAYVYLENGTMVNRLLLEKGMARVYTVQPNSKYADEFYEAQVTAREHKVGFWSD